jgi:hypothetical protein
MNRACAALLVVLAIALPAGCGDDEGGNENTEAAPAAVEPQENPEQTIGEDEDSSGSETPAQPDSGSPEVRRVASDLRRALQQGDGAADVAGVDVTRTAITVRTRLAREGAGAEEASGMCAEVRRFLAQRPAQATVGTVTITGPDGVITRC